MKKVSPLLFGFISTACLFFPQSSFGQEKIKGQPHLDYLFIGRYAPADSNSIFVYRFNTSNGRAYPVSSIKGIDNPSFLTISPNHHFLYAVSETHGADPGKVFAYSFDQASGKLKYLDQQLSGGDDPCNITTDHTGKWVFVANYTSGSFSELPVRKDGSLGLAIHTIQHVGHGVNPLRQASPHVHCILPAPNNHDIFVTDLGLDKVFTYEFNSKNGSLIDGHPPTTSVFPGSGPRHLKFSPNQKNLYLIHEMGAMITVFRYRPGHISIIQTIPTTPKGYTQKKWGADIHFSPDGKFLYASNRDDLNDIVTYTVNQKSGKLTYKEMISSGGKTPRNFMITPNGKYLLVGHQNSNDIVIFKRNMTTGLLTPTKGLIPIPHAVCLKMIHE
ncbi:MAG: lactonase family protein [Chitinophagaceae bacterium]